MDKEYMLKLYREDLVNANKRLKINKAAGRVALAEMDLGRVNQLEEQIKELANANY